MNCLKMNDMMMILWYSSGENDNRFRLESVLDRWAHGPPAQPETAVRLGPTIQQTLPAAFTRTDCEMFDWRPLFQVLREKPEGDREFSHDFF